MKAAQIVEYGPASKIQINEIEIPRPSEGQVLVEVYGSSINPADIKMRQGKMMPLQFPVTLGLDLAGVVTDLGKGVTTFNVGDKVYGQAKIGPGGGGAFAQYAIAPAGNLAGMPKNLNFVQAAAIALTGTSAVQALTEHIKLQPGQKILIHGGAGGIGTFAIQIAKHLGAYVATTVSPDDIDFVKKLGADQVIDYKNQRFEDRLRDYDAVFDTVGGETYTRSFKVLKRSGVVVSMLMPPDARLMQQYGVTAIGQFTKVSTERLNTLTKLVEEGVVTVHIDKTFPQERIREAFEAKERGSVRGKIGVDMKSPSPTLR
ncbi:MAG: NADP-dependent oxidoreductase [Chloroflexi bacterium]|nr:NADP-dependent oxidoreductase [Chloroflexota bacterium]